MTWDTDDKVGMGNTILQGDSLLCLGELSMPNKTSIGGISGQFQPYFKVSSGI